MKILQIILRVKATIIPAFAAWIGMLIYFLYHKNLPHFSFMLWHSVLVVIFFLLATLVYCKFFDYFSLVTVLIIFILTILVADVIAFSIWANYLIGLTALDFIVSYALMVATVSLTHTIYHKPWRKKSTPLE